MRIRPSCWPPPMLAWDSSWHSFPHFSHNCRLSSWPLATDHQLCCHAEGHQQTDQTTNESSVLAGREFTGWHRVNRTLLYRVTVTDISRSMVNLFMTIFNLFVVSWGLVLTISSDRDLINSIVITRPVYLCQALRFPLIIDEETLNEFISWDRCANKYWVL